MQPAPVDFVPQRVVSLVPSLTEALFDLDLGDRLVGITDFCVRPPERVQVVSRVGGTRNPDLARILALHPDLVLANDEENRPEDVDAIQAAGVPVWVTGPRTVFDAINVLWRIMNVFDHAVMIPRVREIERAYDYSGAASEAGTPLCVFAPIWRDPWLTFDNSAYAHDILRVCGGANVFADCAPALPLPDDTLPLAVRLYPRVTLDDIVAAQPEVVLLPDEPYAFGAADVDVFYQLDIPAVRDGRIYLIDGSLLTWHGTRIAYALRDLPGLLTRTE